MAEQKIELRKIRDFGLNINDTFIFLRQNLKPLMTSFFAICGIFMLGQAIFNGIYQSHAMGIFQRLFSGAARQGANVNPMASIFSVEYLLTLVFMLLTFVSMKTVLGAYLKYYLENDGRQPGIEEVWAIFKNYFLWILLYSLPTLLMICIGCLLCGAPGVYLWVVFTPFSLVVMIENVDFGTAFSRCFEIIKQQFWITLAIYVVAYIIYSVSSSIIGAVVAVVAGAAAYFTTRDISTTVGIATSFLNVFSFMFYTIYFISVALQYFTLTEQRDGTGILSRIDAIGTDKNNFDNIEEQY